LLASHVQAGLNYRYGCAVSARHGAYWVGSEHYDILKRDLTSGRVMSTITTRSMMMAMSIDHNFVLAARGNSFSALTSVNARTNAIVDTGVESNGVIVCNDGTIVAFGGYNQEVVAYSIDATGQLTQLGTFNSPIITSIACSPDSQFLVAVDSYYRTVFSYALPLTGATIQTFVLTVGAVSVVFNPANSDVIMLDEYGVLSVRAFDSATGMIGAVQTSRSVGQNYDPDLYINFMQFAYGKLFVYAQSQLQAFDGALNQVSSSALDGGSRSVVCVSEGTLHFVLSTRITKSIYILIYVCVQCGLDIAIWWTQSKYFTNRRAQEVNFDHIL
jgi:hypothetical protein